MPPSNIKSLIKIPLSACLLGGALLGFRVWMSPALPALPSRLPAPVALEGVPKRPVKIITLNLYNRPWQRASRLQAALELLRESDADVIALQEVSTGWLLPGDPLDFFARGLAMPHVRSAWHEQNGGVFRTGLAILSRYPILASKYREFERHDFWDAKGALLARIATPSGEIQVINLHMASTSNEDIRQSEWKELERWVNELQSQGHTKIAVLGDFNTEPSHPAMATFRSGTRASSAYDDRADLQGLTTWSPSYFRSCATSSLKGAAMLDYIFALPPLKLTGARVIEKPNLELPRPSDHCAVYVEIR